MHLSAVWRHDPLCSFTGPKLTFCPTLPYTALSYTAVGYILVCCDVLFFLFLDYTVLHCTVLYYTTMYCTILFCTVPNYAILYCNALNLSKAYTCIVTLRFCLSSLMAVISLALYIYFWIFFLAFKTELANI